MKRYLRIGGIAVAVFILALIAVPLMIDVNRFRPAVESKASAALGRQVTIGSLSLSLLSGSVGADSVTVADDPAFSTSPFVTAKSLKIGVELMPLIFSKQLNVTDITLDEPQITLLKAANGKWNFSSIGAASSKKEPEPEKSGGAAPAKFSIAKLNVSDGKLSVGKANSAVKPVVYDHVNIMVKNFSSTSQFPVELSAKLPRGGDLNVSGKAGPMNVANAANTPLEADLKVDKMVLEALGFIDPASGIAGVADFDGTLNSNGHQAKLVGSLMGKQLKFSPKGTPAPKTVAVKSAMDLDLDKETGAITQGDIAIGKARAHLTGTFVSQGDAEVVRLRLDAPNMPVDELEAMLPSLGIVLPSGSKLQGGTLSATLDISGPLDKLIVTGPVQLSDTKLANFDLGSKLGALSAFTGRAPSSRDTSIQNASVNARVAPEGTRADNINLNVPALGVVTGAGTVSPAGGLNFKMVANLHGGGIVQHTRLADARGSNSGITFGIEGTTSNPKFVPELSGALAKGAVGNLAKKQLPATTAAKTGGIFGRRR